MSGAMKAWVLRGLGDLRFEDVPIPTLKPGEALVKVKCAGICSSDVPRVYTTGAYHYPIVLGHEFSGVVDSVYDDCDKKWLGRRVAAFPLIQCFKCAACQSGRYETCADYGYIGSRQDGAFAEYVAVPVWNLIELPDSVTFMDASLFEPAAVALHAVRGLGDALLDTAAVVGDGTIGRLIAEWLKLRGVPIVTLIGRNDSPVTTNAYFEAVGSVESFELCIKNTIQSGQIVLVGNPGIGFNIERDTYWQILRKQLTLKGSWNSRYPDDWLEVANNADQLNLGDLISHAYQFNALSIAFEMMRSHREKYRKVIVVVD